MARRSPQTQAKRAREVALRERRERKREKKNQTADERAAARGGTEFDALQPGQDVSENGDAGHAAGDERLPGTDAA